MAQRRTYTPTYIDGKPYAVMLPTGGRVYFDTAGQWDSMIKACEKTGQSFHYHSIFSWCQNTHGALSRVVRGCNLIDHWNQFEASDVKEYLGFRPILVPLNAETLQPDSSALSTYEDGATISMGSLYMDGELQANPQTPTLEGDIPDYIPGSRISIRDTDRFPNNQIQWIKVGDFLIADRNLLKNISWNDLDRNGLVFADLDHQVKKEAMKFLEDALHGPVGYESFHLARIMYDLQGRLEFVSLDECYTFAQRIVEASRNSAVPLLTAERTDAVATLLEYGLSDSRAPEFPNATPEQTKELLLTCDIDVLAEIIDYVAEQNQEFYAPDNDYSIEAEESWKRAVDAILGVTSDSSSLEDRIADANQRADSAQQTIEQNDIAR